MSLDERDIARAAEILEDARLSRTPVEPLSELLPTLDLSCAYRVQAEWVRLHVGSGAQLKGHKVGLTSRAMQEQLGVEQLDAGCLLDDMFIAGGAVAASRFIQPRVEPEVASVRPALEVIDSRIRDWRITILDTVADNASCGGVVLGDASLRLSEVDLASTEVVLAKAGRPVEAGTAVAVMGNPLAALAWLANLLAQRGEELLAGQVVLPGSLTRAAVAGPGDRFEATFTGLGSVAVSFLGEPEEDRGRPGAGGRGC
jgi:2-keto-4-pentenoate hydratase